MFAGAAHIFPGGESACEAAEARRGKTELSKLTLVMKPGSWCKQQSCADFYAGVWHP